MLEELAVTVGRDPGLDVEAVHLDQQLELAALERVHLAVVPAIGVGKRLVRTVLGVLVRSEQHLEDVGARDPALGLDPWVQLQVRAHVVDQPGVLSGLAPVVWDQRFHQAEPWQFQQHVVDGVVHRLERVDQGRVPVEQHDPRTGEIAGSFFQIAEHGSSCAPRLPPVARPANDRAAGRLQHRSRREAPQHA